MRISDWSSDVCSSDLNAAPGRIDPLDVEPVRPDRRLGGAPQSVDRRRIRQRLHPRRQAERAPVARPHDDPQCRTEAAPTLDPPGRSENPPTGMNGYRTWSTVRPPSKQHKKITT